VQGACLPHAAALSPWQICAFRLALTAGNCSGRGYSRLRARSDGVAIGLSLPTAHLLLNGRARRSTGNASKKKWQERKHEPTQRRSGEGVTFSCPSPTPTPPTNPPPSPNFPHPASLLPCSPALQRPCSSGALFTNFPALRTVPLLAARLRCLLCH